MSTFQKLKEKNIERVQNFGQNLLCTTTLKIFDAEFPYKLSYFEPLCLPAKMAAETVIRSIEARLQMQIHVTGTVLLNNTSRHYMRRFIADPSVVRNTAERAEKSKLCRMCFMTVPKIINVCSRNKINFITMFSNKTPL